MHSDVSVSDACGVITSSNRKGHDVTLYSDAKLKSPPTVVTVNKLMSFVTFCPSS